MPPSSMGVGPCGAYDVGMDGTLRILPALAICSARRAASGKVLGLVTSTSLLTSVFNPRMYLSFASASLTSTQATKALRKALVYPVIDPV